MLRRGMEPASPEGEARAPGREGFWDCSCALVKIERVLALRWAEAFVSRGLCSEVLSAVGLLKGGTVFTSS